MRQLALAVLAVCLVGGPMSVAAETERKPRRTAAELQAAARKELDALGAKIDALERRSREEGIQSRERIEAQIGTLRSKKSKAEDLFKKLGGAATEAGKDIQTELDRAIGELKQACRDVRRKFDRKAKTPASVPAKPG